VWVAVFFRWTGLLGGCLAILVVGTCFGPAFFNVDIGPLPITADRVLIGFVMVAFVLQRQLGLTRRVALDKSDLALVAFLGALALATFLNDWRADGFRTTSRFLFFFVLPFAVYWVGRSLNLTSRGLQAVYLTFAALALYLALTGIAERFEVWALVFPKYIASPEHWEFFGRARGPLLNPVANGILLCLGMCAALLLWPKLARPGQLAVMIVFPIYCAGIFCTMTRSVWLGALFALCVLIGLALPRNWRLASFTALALAGGLTLVAKWDQMNSFKRDKFVSVANMEQSASLRPILATIAWRMFQERPLLGCGLGGYREACLTHLSDRSSDLPLQTARGYVQHNVFLALLTETGLVGAGLFVLLASLWGWNAWTLWRSPEAELAQRQWGLLFLALLAVFLVNGMFHDVSIMPMMNMFACFMAGATRGLLAPAVAPDPSAAAFADARIKQSTQGAPA